MVRLGLGASVGDGGCFQYSLCRVVLMVLYSADLDHRIQVQAFSTRSVESF